MKQRGDTTGAIISDIRSFDRHSGSLAERLLFNNRLLIVLLCLTVTLMLGLQLGKLRLNAGFEKMIPLHHPFIINYTANKSELSGLGNTLKLAVETTDGTIFSAAYMETLRQINDDVFLLPGVERAYMKSLWMAAVRWVAVTEEGMEGGPVIPDRFMGSAEDLVRLRANVLRSGQIGQLVASDLRSSALVVPLLDRDAAGKQLDYQELSRKLEQIRHKYERGPIKIHIVGFAKLVGDLIDGLTQVLAFFVVAIVICTLVLYWHTRCWRSTLLVMGCSLLAVFWLLGLLPTLGYELDPYSILVPFLVFAIGMSHGAQKMNGIMQDIGRGTHRLVAARYTFRRLFVAGATALLADAVGFGVLMLIPIKIIQDLAVTASIGVAALIFTNLVLLPILLSYVGVSAKGAARTLREESDRSRVQARFWAWLDFFTTRRWATVAVCAGSALAVVGYVVGLRLQVGDLEPGAPELRPGSRYNQDNDFFVSRYAASSDAYVVIVKTRPFECNTYETLSQVDALEWELQQIDQVESTNSFATVARNATVGMNEGSFAWYELLRNQGMLNSITNRGAPRELINQGCDLITLYAYLEDHKAKTLQRVVSVAEAFAAKNNNERIQFLSAAGNAGIEAATNIVVKQANTQMLWLVYAAVTVLAFVTFRSWRAVVCAILPLALTTTLAQALMVELGIGVKVATLPVLALGVGIGVDYALYVLTVTLAGLRQGQTLAQAYLKALLFTGKVVVLTGITLSIAVFTWIASPIKFQADMGVLLAFMFLLNMLGALILLPALAHFLLPTTPVRSAG
jgi:predicted RND superfamily exporter protein